MRGYNPQAYKINKPGKRPACLFNASISNTCNALHQTPLPHKICCFFLIGYTARIFRTIRTNVYLGTLIRRHT